MVESSTTIPSGFSPEEVSIAGHSLSLTLAFPWLRYLYYYTPVDNDGFPY